jgi:hypothetical protein
MAKKAKGKRSKKAPRHAARKTVHRTVRRHVFDPQTGRIGGRAAHAQIRLEALTKKYQAAGMPLEEARQRARNELRDNPRKDWRG